MLLTLNYFHGIILNFSFNFKGWNDGNIRAFTPQSGKLITTIFDAHNKGVSAIAATKDGKKLLSGGIEGQVDISCCFF